MSKQEYIDELERCQEELEHAHDALPTGYGVNEHESLADNIERMWNDLKWARTRINAARDSLSGLHIEKATRKAPMYEPMSQTESDAYAEGGE